MGPKNPEDKKSKVKKEKNDKTVRIPIV